MQKLWSKEIGFYKKRKHVLGKRKTRFEWGENYRISMLIK